MTTMADRNPVTAWKALKEGNERFIAGAAEHPDQSVEHRAGLTSGQQPFAAVLGCSDSRAPVEIIFDQGLGDLFVIRTAGQVLDAAVLGSLEFGVGVLQVPLIVVLGHRSCGAVKATLATVDGGDMPGGYVRDLVERVTPSVLAGRRDGLDHPGGVRGPARHRNGGAAAGPVGDHRRKRSGGHLSGGRRHLRPGRRPGGAARPLR